jgi:hypothetical protein
MSEFIAVFVAFIVASSAAGVLSLIAFGDVREGFRILFSFFRSPDVATAPLEPEEPRVSLMGQIVFVSLVSLAGILAFVSALHWAKKLL